MYFTPVRILCSVQSISFYVLLPSHIKVNLPVSNSEVCLVWCFFQFNVYCIAILLAQEVTDYKCL